MTYGFKKSKTTLNIPIHILISITKVESVALQKLWMKIMLPWHQ